MPRPEPRPAPWSDCGAKAAPSNSAPLFTYYEDEKPGDTWGDRVGGIWGSTFNALIAPGGSATDFEP